MNDFVPQTGEPRRIRHDQRPLRVVHDVGGGVEAGVVVGGVHPEGLFAHGGLIGVAGRLIMVGEGNDRRAHTQHHGRVDFAVGVRRGARPATQVHRHPRLQLLRVHGAENILLLIHVNVLDYSTGDKIFPASPAKIWQKLLQSCNKQINFLQSQEDRLEPFQVAFFSKILYRKNKK